MKNSKRASISAIASALAAILSMVGPADTGATLPMGRVKADAALQFVTAANRGDYRTVCRLYSARYLKVSQASCCALYRWGAELYRRYDYRIVGRRTLANGRRRVDLVRWRHSSFIELVREQAGWRIVAGGW
jgi:hypothetical protein